MNKLEDWIYTPYFTSFKPSMEGSYEDSWQEELKPYPAERLRQDREYALEILNFINSADLKTVENPLLWKICRAYLNLMTENYSASINEISTLLKDRNLSNPVVRQLKILKALALSSGSKNGNLPDEIKPVLMKEFGMANNKLIFAVARELEFKGNTTDAAILLSKLNERVDIKNYDTYWRTGIYWRTPSHFYTMMVNYYDDYFFYLDASYTTKQISDLISDLKENNKNDDFDKWKYSVIKNDIPRLYDMLGTKYLRQDNLQSALDNFEKVDDSLWSSKYYPYKDYLNSNPFSPNFYNQHKKNRDDTVQFTKVGVTKRLIEYLKKAEDTKNKDRDYYYFLAANCYFNMSEYGNSWLMKRYYWTVWLHETLFEDDDDYFKCKLAIKYYLKAKEVSKSKKFKALCTRMAGRCDDYRFDFINREKSSDTNYELYVESRRNQNQYYNDLKSQHSIFYNDLISNCETMEKFFAERK